MNKMFIYYGIFMILFFGYGIFSMIVNKKAIKKTEKSFLEKNPNAVKIYTKSGGFIIHNKMDIYNVNDEVAVNFSDEKGYGVYAIPGNNKIEVEFSWTRPGILHKKVTTSTGVVTFEVELKSNRAYILTYDKKENEFKIDEM